MDSDILTEIALQMAGYEMFDSQGNPCELNLSNLEESPKPRAGPSLQAVIAAAENKAANSSADKQKDSKNDSQNNADRAKNDAKMPNQQPVEPVKLAAGEKEIIARADVGVKKLDSVF